MTTFQSELSIATSRLGDWQNAGALMTTACNALQGTTELMADLVAAAPTPPDVMPGELSWAAQRDRYIREHQAFTEKMIALSTAVAHVSYLVNSSVSSLSARTGPAVVGAQVSYGRTPPARQPAPAGPVYVTRAAPSDHSSSSEDEEATFVQTPGKQVAAAPSTSGTAMPTAERSYSDSDEESDASVDLSNLTVGTL